MSPVPNRKGAPVTEPIPPSDGKRRPRKLRRHGGPKRASPLTHEDPAVEHERHRRVAELTAALLKQGRSVFALIVYGFDLGICFGLCGSWSFWKKFDIDFLNQCDELWVYTLPGWTVSVGVAAEISHAEVTGKPTTFISEAAAQMITLCIYNNKGLMVSTLVSLLVLALMLYVVIYILGMLSLPDPARLIGNVLLALVVLLYVARLLGVGV